MTRRKTPSRRKKSGRHFLSLLLGCSFCALVGSWVWELWGLNNTVESQLKTLTAQKTTLLEQKIGLENEIKRLNTPSYIEQLAREQLGLVRPGEILIAPKENP